jgi:hypothetical protein
MVKLEVFHSGQICHLIFSRRLGINYTLFFKLLVLSNHYWLHEIILKKRCTYEERESIAMLHISFAYLMKRGWEFLLDSAIHSVL